MQLHQDINANSNTKDRSIGVKKWMTQHLEMLAKKETVLKQLEGQTQQIVKFKTEKRK